MVSNSRYCMIYLSDLFGHDFFWPIVSFVHNIDRFKYSNLAIKYELLSFVQQKVLEIIQTPKLAKKTSKDDYDPSQIGAIGNWHSRRNCFCH